MAQQLIKTIANYTNNADINLTDTEILAAYNAIDKAGTFTFTLTTKNGSTTIGTDSKTAIGTAAGTVKIGTESGNKRGIVYIGTAAGNKKRFALYRYSRRQ